MAALEVRSARADELPAVSSLLAEAYAEHIARFPARLGDAYAREIVDVTGRTAFSDVVIAVRDGEVVGTVTFVPDAADDGHAWPPDGSIMRLLAVSPRARRHAVGSVLVREVILRARERGVAYVGLHTAPFMDVARRLYERVGFRRAAGHDFDPFGHYLGIEASPEDVAAAQGLAYLLPLVDVPEEETVVEVALPHDPTMASLARRAVRGATAHLAAPDDLELCTSEIVTNALLHGSPPVRLEISTSPETVRVSVVDSACGAVVAREATSAAASGRGLMLVASTASRWGVRPTLDGKAVWFEMDLPGDG